MSDIGDQGVDTVAEDRERAQRGDRDDQPADGRDECLINAFGKIARACRTC